MPRPGHTRERMMDVAERLFARYGYGGVSVEDVTSAVGVKKPDLYNHFRDKSELYVAVRLRRLGRLQVDLGRALAAGEAAGLLFPERLTAAAAVLLRHPWFLSALAQREAETFLPPETRDLLFARAYAGLYRPLSGLLRAGAGGLPEHRVPIAVEAFLGLAIHFAALQAAEKADPAGLMRAAADVAALWRHGVSALCADDGSGD